MDAVDQDVPGERAAIPSRWARLTWQAGDPEALAALLALRLGVPAVRVDGEAGAVAWRLDLGGEPLDVVPWRREGPRDEPAREGRLTLEPIPRGLVPALDPDAPLALIGIVWGTVDLDRAAADLDLWLAPDDPALGDGDAPADPHLGARTRIRRSVALPGGTLVLAEPTTEGRLAASLARDSEGPSALLLRPAAGLDAWVAEARRRDVQVSARRRGPLGSAVLLPGRIAAGPHLLIVEAPKTVAGRSTIAP
jgi:hypothetical protein